MANEIEEIIEEVEVAASAEEEEEEERRYQEGRRRKGKEPATGDETPRKDVRRLHQREWNLSPAVIWNEYDREQQKLTKKRWGNLKVRRGREVPLHSMVGIERRLRIEELHQELGFEIMRIVKCGDRRPERLERALQAIDALRFLKDNDDYSQFPGKLRRIGSVSVPHFFLCPLSKKLMRNPVVLSNGKTFDRASAEKWLADGNRRCPVTREALTHTTLIPNYQVFNMILHWSLSESVCLSAQSHAHIEQEPLAAEQQQRDRIANLVKKPRVAQRLRNLINNSSINPAVFGRDPAVIAQLLKALFRSCSTRSRVQHLVATVLVAASQGAGVEIVGNDPLAIPLLSVLVRHAKSMETRTKCATALLGLSVSHANKLKIGELGGVAALAHLMKNGDAPAQREASRAVASLCTMARENWMKAVRERAVDVALTNMEDATLVDASLGVLYALRDSADAVEELLNAGWIRKLAPVFDGDNITRRHNKAAAVAWAACGRSRERLREALALEQEHRFQTCFRLAQEMGGGSAANAAAEDGSLKALLVWLKRSAEFPKTTQLLRETDRMNE